MNKKEILLLGNSILINLQKRDGIDIYNKNNLTINIDGEEHLFSYYQLYYSIALALKDFHSIPPDYLKYYFKPVSVFNIVNPNSSQLKFIQKILKNFKPSEILMAGGSFAKTFLKKEKNKKVVIKEAYGNHSKKLSNELNFFLKLAKNPIISFYLPQIISFKKKDKFTSITLRHYPFPTLTYNILFGKIEKEKAWDWSLKVLNFIKNNLWTTEISQPPKNYIKEFFLKRIKENTELLLQKAPSLTPLVNLEKVMIGNKIYPNLLKIVNIIEKDEKLIKLLTPPFICNIWGDLHPNNILILKNKFILIDPRGEIGDPMYDIGKIYHTFGPGRYDFVDNDLYSISLEYKNIPIIKRKFLTEHPSWPTYNYLCKKFERNMNKFIFSQDHFWKLRWAFINFCIYATMPPFLVKNKPQESRAIMGYSNALIFGKKFLELKKRISL